MTAKQFQRRHYSEKSYAWAQFALRTLARHEYVVEREQTAKSRHGGSGALIYYLTRTGKNYLRLKHVPILIKYTPSFLPRADWRDMEHPLAITDTLITADLAAEQYPDYVQIRELRHEKLLEKQLKNRRPLVDGWELFHVAGETGWYPFPIAWEIDNDTERNEALFKSGKVEQVIQWYETVYPQYFGTAKLTIAFISLAGANRRDIMKQWVAEELIRLRKRHLVNLFRFTDLHPATTDPYTFFFEDVWQLPFWSQPVTLLTEVRGSP